MKNREESNANNKFVTMIAINREYNRFLHNKNETIAININNNKDLYFLLVK